MIRKSACCSWELKSLKSRFTRQRQGCCSMRFGMLPTRRRLLLLVTVQTSLMIKILIRGSILAVEARDGTTIIAGIDEAGKSALHDRLYTTGELLRLNQLQPDPASIDAAKGKFPMNATDPFTETTEPTQHER